MTSNKPNTVNQALKILAYNEWAWQELQKPEEKINPHPKDRATVSSLAEAQYSWTERQGKLAVVLLKRYATKFSAHGMDITHLIKNPVFDSPFRVISSAKTIEVIEEIDTDPIIEMRFPYSKKIVDLIRCLKQQTIPASYFIYDGENKSWRITKTDVTTFYCTLVGIRYNFDFITPSLLDDFEEIKKTKLTYKRPHAILKDDNIFLKNVHENLQQYWDDNIAGKKTLLQLDALKNLNVDQSGIKVKAYSEVAKKIAHNCNQGLWVDKNSYSKDQFHCVCNHPS